MHQIYTPSNPPQRYCYLNIKILLEEININIVPRYWPGKHRHRHHCNMCSWRSYARSQLLHSSSHQPLHLSISNQIARETKENTNFSFRYFCNERDPCWDLNLECRHRIGKSKSSDSSSPSQLLLSIPCHRRTYVSARPCHAFAGRPKSFPYSIEWRIKKIEITFWLAHSALSQCVWLFGAAIIFMDGVECDSVYLYNVRWFWSERRWLWH